MMIEKIVSGGQTGVDRAALDIAIELGINHGAWCPKGRWAEDAPIDEKYQLVEVETSDPSERTKLNVRDSDGTLILIKDYSIGEGTQLTINEAKQLKKPLLVVNLHEKNNSDAIRGWLYKHNITILNIAGPRASQSAGIYDEVCTLLKQCLPMTMSASFQL